MASPDPIAGRIRAGRTRLGWSLQALATEAARRLPRRRRSGRATGVSPAYLSLIENGHKVPDEPVARAIAEALGEDPALFRAWVAARKRANLDSALDAAGTLARALAAGGGGGFADAPLVEDAARDAGAEPPAPDTAAAGHARLRVPVIAAGDDPGDGVRPSCGVIEWRSLDSAALSPEARARLHRPFAIRLSAPAAGLVAGDHVLVLRRLGNLPPERVCAVRFGGTVALRRVIWNGRRALLLPPPGGSVFDVVEARDEAALAAHVLGIARRVTFTA